MGSKLETRHGLTRFHAPDGSELWMDDATGKAFRADCSRAPEYDGPACRYEDCAEQHPVPADDNAPVTCPTCRADLGLPPADYSKVKASRSQPCANEQRLDRAKRALRGGNYRDEDPQTNLVDLLSDLRHWSDAMGLDLPAALATSQMHYKAECAEVES